MAVLKTEEAMVQDWAWHSVFQSGARCEECRPLYNFRVLRSSAEFEPCVAASVDRSRYQSASHGPSRRCNACLRRPCPSRPRIKLYVACIDFFCFPTLVRNLYSEMLGGGGGGGGAPVIISFFLQPWAKLVRRLQQTHPRYRFHRKIIDTRLSFFQG